MNTWKRMLMTVLTIGAVGLSVACGSSGSVTGPTSDSSSSQPAPTSTGSAERTAPSPSPSPSPTPSPSATPSPSPTPSPSSETEFRGTIESISAPNLVVSGRLVRTDGSTRFRRSGNVVGFGALQVGQFVEVEGAALRDGSVQASKVGIEDGPGDDDNGSGQGEVEFTGRVDSIAPPSLVVSGRLVVTDASTRVERGGSAIALSSIKAGDRVEVEGTQRSDGSVRAKKVKLED